MDRLLYIAMNGAKHSLYQQAVTSHNLANVSTNGYKAQNGAFRALPVFGPGEATRTFVVDSTPTANLSSGVLRTTGRPLDVAIQGSGWIAVQDAKGKEAYTRNGSLQMTSSGLLITSNGQTVVGQDGPITVPADSEINIGKDGTISVITNNQYNAAVTIGRIKLVSPPDANMVRGDDGLFRQSNGQAAQADAGVNLAAGVLESSNVSAVDALIGIIDQSRFFDMQIKLMQTADENANRASQVMSLTS
ncbi:flagellar basal-body rod protein FlgF [Novimethylophilus kurashikiensis]|uniref:Flagellar basal-body rod protein FlgF n=1 Tax=Novimethylophilus kurashikiensis TaxID=1825523 RepID=A0A2R5FJ37_9PROT|nr:flagellar basal-body rod protein FlgF [Novimethylophilus kurashikiensis]GBG15824.1 flagellar basal-body rod protein FlgF [Novimethylophilus kurashikiensis]